MYCAIDFGTSNSAIAVPHRNSGGANANAKAEMRLVPLEGDHSTMPTAVFYFADGPEHDGPPRAFGRAAVAAYVDGLDGRLMRSMKSILGSPLVEQSITFDMGGTSTDTARFDGHFDLQFVTKIDGIELHNPTLAIETVAAGGGSICSFDGQKLRVGPESAGANPGPACYGAGGPLTDRKSVV